MQIYTITQKIQTRKNTAFRIKKNQIVLGFVLSKKQHHPQTQQIQAFQQISDILNWNMAVPYLDYSGRR
jgi:hypothetical protein